SRGRYGISVGVRGANEFHNVVLDGQQLPLVALGINSDDFGQVTINPGDGTVFGMLTVGVDPVVNGLTIGSGGDAYQAGIVVAGSAYRPVILNAHVAGQAGRVRRVGPPSAPSAATRSVIPVLVDSAGSTNPSEAAPIVQSSSFA